MVSIIHISHDTLSENVIDGMVVIWSPTSTPQTSTYGSDLTPEELQNEKEFWRVRCMFRYVDLLNLQWVLEFY
jgi:hypothetical protein